MIQRKLYGDWQAYNRNPDNRTGLLNIKFAATPLHRVVGLVACMAGETAFYPRFTFHYKTGPAEALCQGIKRISA